MFGWTQRRPSNMASESVKKWFRLRLNSGAGWASMFGFESAAGKTVTRETALQLAAVWACVRLTAQAVAAMPLQLYRKQPDGGRAALGDDPLGDILSQTPNADQTAHEFWEGMAAWLATQGNAFAEKGYVGARLVALQPLADKCHPRRAPDGVLVYDVTDRGKVETLPREKVFHLRGFGFGGDLGLSPIRYGVQTFGTAIATVETAGKIFANGLLTAGVLSSDQALKQPQREQLQEIMGKYVGSDKAGKLMILEAGLKYQQLTLNPEDAQMLDSRRFDIEEICRWFGIPPIIVGHAAAGQTMWGSGVEQIMIAWLTLGLNPLLSRIEQRIRKDLIAPGDRRAVYAEFNREGLLQADSAGKASFLSSLTQNGLMTRNEGRAKLNLPKDPSSAADQLTAQTSLAPLAQLGGGSDQSQAKAAFLRWLGLSEEAKP